MLNKHAVTKEKHILRLFVVILAAMGVMIGAVFAGDLVKLNSATTPYSEFKIRKLKAKGEPTTPPPGSEIVGEFFLPKGTGPYPAVVLTHDCRGVRPFQRERAKIISGWGYATLLVDSYSTRGISGPEVCADAGEWKAKEAASGRSFDIYGAIEWLTKRSDIDATKLFVVAWDLGATLSAIAREGAHTMVPNLKITAAVSIAPNCANVSSGEFITSLLVIAAANDDWWPAKNCEKMVAAGTSAGSDIILKTLDASRGFDDDQFAEPFNLSNAYNPNKSTGRGATYHYNEAAASESLELIRSYLTQKTNE
jgi:dienelactone hydrolase